MAPTDDSPRIAPSAAREVRGEVVFRSLNEQYARVKEEGREWKVIMNPNSTVVETWGPQDQAMSFADVIPGAEVIAEGTAEGTIVFVAEKVRIVKTANTIISAPRAKETVGQSFQILGLSRTFENNVSYRVIAEDGSTVLAQGFTTATGPDIGHFSLFDVIVDVKEYRGRAVVEAFEHSAKDGEVINLTAVPVAVDGNYHVEAAYFSNRYKDTGAMRCEETYPAYRTTRTLQTLRALSREEAVKGYLTALLKGVTDTEDEAGYFSSIPKGVMVENIAFDGSSKVRVTFNDALDRGVGGSCRVSAIRSQIVNTVKAAVDGIEDVEIAIGDRVEDVLQP